MPRDLPPGCNEFDVPGSRPEDAPLVTDKAELDEIFLAGLKDGRKEILTYLKDRGYRLSVEEADKLEAETERLNLDNIAP